MSSPLRTQFNNYMTLRVFSPKTKQAYINAVAGLAQYYKKSPDTLSCDQIQGYLLHLIQDRRLAWSSCNIAFCAFRCFYAKLLHWDIATFSLPPRPRDRRLPVALSMEEVGMLLNAVSNIKHRVLLMTVYGAGLRVSEAVGLQPHHIEGSRRMIRVEQGKGRKDRYTILPGYLLQELRAYWQQHQPAT